MCFQLHVKPDRIADYIRSHEQVWPEMLAALQDSGWRNYSLFLRPDGLLIGYFEAESVAGAITAMSHQEVNTRWQSAMSEMFADADGDGSGELVRLPEVFNLGEQLSQQSQ